MPVLQYEQPLDWPYKELKPLIYEQEAAEWKDGWLVDVPEAYRTPAGDVCAANLGAEVKANSQKSYLRPFPRSK